MGKYKTWAGAVSLAALMLATSANGLKVHAQSLPAALSAAYEKHPAILAERARLRATDEQVPQALSNWRPTITTSADAGHKLTSTTRDPAGVSVTLSQPVFRGFRTLNETKQAHANIQAGRQELLITEQQILLQAATAYMDVIRDRRIVSLRRRNVSVLAEQLKASRTRLRLGEITRTDVAQSKARLALARSNLATAGADAAVSVANFIRFIGRKPRKLKFPPVSRRLPPTLKAALTLAEDFNPEVLVAVHNEIAALHFVDVKTGELYPRLSFEVEYGLRFEPEHIDRHNETGTIRATLSVPIYQSGRVYSQIREAKHLASRRRLLILDARRKIRAQVVRTWRRYQEAKALIAALNVQVSANLSALDGVRQEVLAGTRTTLDVLDSERELVESQVSLARARHDLIVRAYEVVASVGHMTAKRLGLSVAAYDPAANLDDVDHSWFGARVNEE